MSRTQYKGMVVGIALGAVSVFLTYHLTALFQADPNLAVKALKTVGIALILPGLIAAIVLGDVHTLRLWIAAIVNFLFWFGFSWLFGVLVEKLLKLRHAIAAVGSPGSLSAEQNGPSSPLGSG
jgi:uncharacterized protein (DUF2342 family)